MIKYLGSKRQLIPWIVDAINKHCEKHSSVLDLFSGTSRVGFALKQQGFQVEANDHNLFAYHIAKCYVECDLEDLPENFPQIIEHLNGLEGKPGFFTENYSIKARFFHPDNGAKIEAIRNEIDKLDVNEKIRSLLLVSLMEAADRIDSTCGIQMAYLKSWAKRASNPLSLRIPKLAPKGLRPSRAHWLDAVEASAQIKCDTTYLDPPYNQHNYRSNYHIWETLVRFDEPEVYGTVNKRIDCQTQKSDFNSKKKFKLTLKAVLDGLKSRHIIMSFSNEGFIDGEDLEDLLSTYGKVTILGTDYKRYVGAQIGIYNQKGAKVGQIKNLHNKEFLYVVDCR